MKRKHFLILYLCFLFNAFWLQISVPHPYRRCLLGFACDFFVYDGSTCVFLPFLPIKSIGIHDIVKSASGNIGYMLHCSGSQENMVVNSDMSTFSEERKILKKHIILWCKKCWGVITFSAWEVTNNCTSMQLAEQQTPSYKMETKVATNGMYQFCLFMKCETGKSMPIRNFLCAPNLSLQ